MPLSIRLKILNVEVYLIIRKREIMKRNIISLVLSILCFIIVGIGSLIDKSNTCLNIVLCIIIFISIIIQTVVIVREKIK